MHYLVRLIVEGENVEEANEKAGYIMDNLVEWNEFDWYTGSNQDSGWEDCWKPVRLDSKTGQTWVQSAMNTQYEEFMRCMKSVRHMVLKYDDKQIFEEEFDRDFDVHLSRYYFSKVSGCRANACHLYDTIGDPITNRRELGYFLKDSDNLWVVQVDCHN